MADSNGGAYRAQHKGLTSRAAASGRTFYQQRSYEEALRAKSLGFANRAQWQEYRSTHTEQLEDLRRKDSDVSKAWRQYENGKDQKANLKQSVDFASARERIGRVQRSRKISAKDKKRVSNAIMHEYMRKYHKRMMGERRERIVWDIEGETP